MRIVPSLLMLGLAVVTAGSGAQAAVQTITRTGSVFHLITEPFLNPDGLTSLPGIALGDALSFSATYDDADAHVASQFPGQNVVAVSLGNGNPVNAVSLTIGSQHFSLTDQYCFHGQCGQEFDQGPTLLFHNGQFLGLDSALNNAQIGGCECVLDNLTLSTDTNVTPYGNKDLFGILTPAVAPRSDIFFLSTPGFGDVVFLAQFDGPGVAAVPEPATWVLLIGGFGFVGGALRARGTAVVAA